MRSTFALPIRPGIVEIAYRKTPEPLKRTDLPPLAGARLYTGARRHKHNDNVVLEARRLHEQAGLPMKQIVGQIQQHGIAISYEDVSRYCRYATRGVLVPEPGAGPYL